MIDVIATTTKQKTQQECSVKPINVELYAEAVITAAEGENKGPPRFEVLAYTGQAMRPHCQPPMEHPVVIDLEGMSVPKQRLPLLRDHKSDQVLGHSEKIEKVDSKLIASGVISGAGPAAAEITASAKMGFVWGVSVGATLSKVELIQANKSVSVNSKTFKGPLYVARASRLREISLLALPADDDTAATIAAEAADKGSVMLTFAEWLKANGFRSEAKLTASRLIVLRAQFKACGGIQLEDVAKTSLQATLDAIEEPSATLKAGAGDDTLVGDGKDDYAVELKAEVEAIRREQNVYRLCGDKHPDIAEKAIKAKWTDDLIKVSIEAAELRASLPQGIQIRGNRAKDAPSDGLILEAACAMTGGMVNLAKKFDEKVLNEATSRFKNGIGLQELIMHAAHANGYTGQGIRQDLRGVMESAFNVQAAQFSTVSLPGIFANTANKFLMEGYTNVEQAWREIAARTPGSDFKTMTSWRLTGDAVFEELPPDGEIKHGTLGEESYPNTIRTYAKMFAITRQMIINDDLSALTAIPRKLGRGAALGLNQKFWAEFLLDQASFYTAGRGNYISGAGSALSIAGLTAAITAFRRLEDTDGNPLAITPTILLVPPELEATALTINAAVTVNTGGSSTTAQVPNSNIYAGRFKIIVSTYLTDAAEWYLIANPADIPLLEVRFLNGKEAPTIEQADTDFNTLGVQFRGYFDFGISKQDHRAGIKANGT